MVGKWELLSVLLSSLMSFSVETKYYYFNLFLGAVCEHATEAGSEICGDTIWA